MDRTIREMSAELGITVDAIHKQKKRHPNIAEHCHRDGRVWRIDEIGQDLLRQYTTPQRHDDEIVSRGIIEERDEYRQRYQEALVRIAQLESQRADAAEQIATAQTTQLLLEQEQQTTADLRAELDSFRPFAFGLYRKK